MSSKSIQIIGGPERQHAHVDGTAHALVTMDHLSAQVAKGNAYFVHRYTDELADDTDLDFAFTVVTPIRLRLWATVSGRCEGTFYENADFSDGTSLGVHNKDASSSNTSDLTAVIGPTVSDPGDEIQAIGSQGPEQVEWVLGAGDYLLRLHNVSGGTIEVSHFMEFYHA